MHCLLIALLNAFLLNFECDTLFRSVLILILDRTICLIKLSFDYRLLRFSLIPSNSYPQMIRARVSYIFNLVFSSSVMKFMRHFFISEQTEAATASKYHLTVILLSGKRSAPWSRQRWGRALRKGTSSMAFVSCQNVIVMAWSLFPIFLSSLRDESWQEIIVESTISQIEFLAPSWDIPCFLFYIKDLWACAGTKSINWYLWAHSSFFSQSIRRPLSNFIYIDS